MDKDQYIQNLEEHNKNLEEDNKTLWTWRDNYHTLWMENSVLRKQVDKLSKETK